MSANLNDLRQRVLDGLPYTAEELAAAVRALIDDRLKVLDDPKPAKKTKAPPVDLNDLL